MSINPQFQPIFEQFKDHKTPTHTLESIQEVFIPFNFCKKAVLIEKELTPDRFSIIILELIQTGYTTHLSICDFLGVATDSFVTIQFNFLIKNGFIEEKGTNNDAIYKITHSGITFLKERTNITTIQSIDFEYYTMAYTTKVANILHPNLKERAIDIELTKNAGFKGYILRQSKDFDEKEHKIKKIKCENPHINKVEFVQFFNKEHKISSFYDFADKETAAHKRFILFLALEYIDETGAKYYEIRRTKKSVKAFNEYELEEKLTDDVNKFNLMG